MNLPARLRVHKQKLVSILVVGFLAAAGMALTVAPSSQAAALTASTWSVSNNQTAETAITYTYNFTTGTAGPIKTVTFTVSGTGLAGTPGIAKAYGLGAGTISIAGQTVTYTVTNPVVVGANVGLYLEISGLTNPAAGTDTTSITTNDATPAVIDGPTTTPSVVIGGANTAANATLAKSLTFSNDAPSFQLALDPSLPALSNQFQQVQLRIQTNASQGYTLSVSGLATGLRSSSAGHPVLPPVASGKATAVPWPADSPAFGYTVMSGGGDMTIDPAFSAGSKFAGFTSAGETVASRSTTTGGSVDLVLVNEQASITYATPAGDYTDTITYTVTPNYG